MCGTYDLSSAVHMYYTFISALCGSISVVVPAKQSIVCSVDAHSALDLESLQKEQSHNCLEPQCTSFVSVIDFHCGTAWRLQ